MVTCGKLRATHHSTMTTITEVPCEDHNMNVLQIIAAIALLQCTIHLDIAWLLKHELTVRFIGHKSYYRIQILLSIQIYEYEAQSTIN